LWDSKTTAFSFVLLKTSRSSFPETLSRLCRDLKRNNKAELGLCASDTRVRTQIGRNMNKRMLQRWLVILVVTLLCVWRVVAYPGLVPSKERLKENVKLGLDLRGGTHLVLQVITDDAIRGEADRAIDSMRQELNRRNVVFRQITRPQNNTIQIVGVDPNKDAEFRSVVSELFAEWDLVSTSGEVPNTYSLRVKTAQEQLFRAQSVDQAINTIRNRIDQLGVGEVVIQKHGGPGADEIVVQLPGVDDPARVKGIIQNTAQLELKLVEGGPFPSQAAAAQSYAEPGGRCPELRRHCAGQP
jgi:preprotein translocase subunit SecD